eukprot:9937776-Alexandrium_andersonii.AAC.1
MGSGASPAGDFELIKWPGADAPADMLAKAVNGDTIGKHMSALGVHWEGGRAESAPLLGGFSWDKLGPNGGSSGSGP